ncbi:MAG: hypothetical protein QXR73_03310 [Candidatus Micrarchaeaceae archaeon]
MEFPENTFSRRYNLVARRIIGMLSEDSGIPITKMASAFGLSRRIVVRKLKKPIGRVPAIARIPAFRHLLHVWFTVRLFS